MKRPKILFFDVNETLLDLGAMKTSVAKALNGRADLLPLWFTTMLQYSLVATVGDNYDDFGEIGAAAIIMVARNNGITLSQDAARKAMQPIRSLPPHPDVLPALDELKKAGFRMVTLTNSSQAGVDEQISNVELMDKFEARLSIEDIQMFKPHGHVYQGLIGQMADWQMPEEITSLALDLTWGVLTCRHDMKSVVVRETSHTTLVMHGRTDDADACQEALKGWLTHKAEDTSDPLAQTSE